MHPTEPNPQRTPLNTIKSRRAKIAAVDSLGRVMARRSRDAKLAGHVGDRRHEE